MQTGRGCWLTEPGGRRLLDLSATWSAVALGHGHPAVASAVAAALANPPGAGTLSAVHPDSIGLAEDLLALVPGDGERRVYFGHSGSDANDVAIRCARHATGKPTVLAFEHGYHGGFGVAMRASGVHLDAGNVGHDPSILFAPYPDPYRGTTVQQSLAAVTEALSSGRIACVIVEPMLSDGGIVVPPDGFLRELATACSASAALLICDEVKVGLGRTGLLHAFAHDGITPDLVTFGKALGGGLPMSATVGPAWVLDQPVASALLTTAGNPVCTAAARAVLRVLTTEQLADRAAEAGDRLMAGLQKACAGLPVVGDIRGRGLAIGIDLVRDPTTRERSPDLAALTVYRLWELGAVAFYVGGNVVEITPPLIISDAEIDHAVELLAHAISDAAAGTVDPAVAERYAGW
ncbi:aspartate aminotransferase family protein [Streptomyces coffeae]|uniref:Aminotransferase class III-fold pyridoxal phosphate-dependent enzyme n=1 Tax=Streptomyces coffeae TaxID=621382 RepID=A0ABS1NNR6_9ACTN|nr:aminotransferase class III-fold pyridoxal phosphate-dependent enzyme [Streptomyces coffeae]MBL1101734.1 aminotransferase class III-fold pyridoxal phosphate-dependent enzyme [Streptomyces coffeae]